MKKCISWQEYSAVNQNYIYFFFTLTKAHPSSNNSTTLYNDLYNSI